MVRFDLNIRCNFTNHIYLKELGKKIVAEFENRIIIEVKRKLSLNQTELAKFFGIDTKTLRTKNQRKD